MSKKQTCFGAIHIHDKTRRVLPWTVHALAHLVRKEVGDAYRRDGEATAAGWIAARKAGVRVVKIEVRVIN